MGAKLLGNQREQIINILSIASYLNISRELFLPPPHSFIFCSYQRPPSISAIPPNPLADTGVG